ncbi:efflux RND transporter periplasmic adaptor subunit [Pontiella agarivorans]|uniref:Efflux RND transporter periplasmic adaptor subunit n=1 Tax=Pontiella agarivorans TaxID=3038953 RepID=A0ABU5MYL5_9BACT|nr:efflux RND transporter periplasmic adaptor subunit [Pontiella agarivorans]MDZ8119268.1 efflux RND transporter periplasmic adaptor subunit [Pontiella agarivorans]
MEHDLSKTMAEFPSAGKKQTHGERFRPLLLAAVLLAAMVLLLGIIFRAQLTPAVPVETARVMLLEQEEGGTQVSVSGTPQLLFQASGWVEPDPWHESIAVKTDGYVEEVFVREGDAVTNGQMLARLDPADHQLALAEADANVRKQEAVLNSKKSIADAELKQVEAARFKVEAAVARLTRERDTSERYANSSPGVISHADRVSAEQAVVEFEAEEKAARAGLTALEARAVAAEAEIKVAAAALASAKEQRAMARLALDRTVVRSTMDGIILQRFVKPGDKRVVMSDDPHSAHIAEVYNPEKLQVRVDVPLSEAGKLQVGQPAKITTAMLPGRTFEGRVISITGQADLQRNTLQAKVAISEPDPRMRPDVLCRVEFYGVPVSGVSGAVSASGYSLWIPQSALQSDAAEQPVWVVDPLNGVAEQRMVKLTGAVKEGFRGVSTGVRANEKVIVQAEGKLAEGVRVKEISK